VLVVLILVKLMTITVWTFFSKTCSVNVPAVPYWNEYWTKLCNYLYIWRHC